MWELLKQWFNEHKVLIGLLLLLSIGLGLLTVGVCFFFPSALGGLASLTLFGVAPLAFLAVIQLPLALLALGVITATVAFGGSAGGVLIANQLISMTPHLWNLFAIETVKPVEPLMNESYSYLHAHLRTTADYVEGLFEEDYDDISSSNSSEQDETRSSTFSRNSSRLSWRSDTENEHSTFISFPRSRTI